jgi:hypothetical protein
VGLVRRGDHLCVLVCIGGTCGQLKVGLVKRFCGLGIVVSISIGAAHG